MHDVVVIGGGIVGLATALAITDTRPGATVAIVDKEQRWGAHQTGHNSGVIHSGIYYRPGSHKATLCRDGNRSMIAFCEEHDIPHERCGKLIVATSQAEVPALDVLAERGQANGARPRRLRAEEIADYEPHVRGVAALHVASTGIVDYGRVAHAMADVLATRGVTLHLGCTVTGIGPARAAAREVRTSLGPLPGRLIVNCAGLFSDRMARSAGDDLGARIVPFRGDYYELIPSQRHLARNLVYPVPDATFPFLGVHLTRMIDGSVHAGPNAVLALRREGYRKRDIDRRDALESLTYPGVRRLARRHARAGGREVWRALSKRSFVRSLARLVPDITADDVVPAPSGVRAQAVTPDGTLVDDFIIVAGDRIVHVGNAPSPAATASLEIGRHIAGLLPPCNIVGR